MRSYFDHRGACRDALKHRCCPGRWLGVVSLGFDPDGRRIRKKVYGRTRTDVKDKLKQLREGLDRGIETSASYTMERPSRTGWNRASMAAPPRRSAPTERCSPAIQHPPGGVIEPAPRVGCGGRGPML
jgi:hypothetical protein